MKIKQKLLLHFFYFLLSYKIEDWAHIVAVPLIVPIVHVRVVSVAIPSIRTTSLCRSPKICITKILFLKIINDYIIYNCVIPFYKIKHK